MYVQHHLPMTKVLQGQLAVRSPAQQTFKFPQRAFPGPAFLTFDLLKAQQHRPCMGLDPLRAIRAHVKQQNCLTYQTATCHDLCTLPTFP